MYIPVRFPKISILIVSPYSFKAELRLFPRSFYVSTQDIFSNDWSDPVYFGMSLLYTY